MKSSKIFMKGSKDSPEVKMDRNGKLSISGNSICISPDASYDPLISWINSYTGERLNIKIDLNLVNCSSVKKILQTIRAVEGNSNIKEKRILWQYYDQDQEELGKMISSVLTSLQFEFSHKA